MAGDGTANGTAADRTLFLRGNPTSLTKFKDSAQSYYQSLGEGCVEKVKLAQKVRFCRFAVRSACAPDIVAFDSCLRDGCCLALTGGGGATPRVLGRQLPPPPPQRAFGQQLVAKGVALRRPWAPKALDAP